MRYYIVTRMHRATRTYSTETVRASSADMAIRVSRRRFPNDVRFTARRYDSVQWTP